MPLYILQIFWNEGYNAPLNIFFSFILIVLPNKIIYVPFFYFKSSKQDNLVPFHSL